jgi:DNA polymerase-1
VHTADNQGRVHGSFNQFGTGTGRFSSSKPNLQNIPSSRTKEGDLIRKAFIAEDGYRLIVADYSQVELRVVTHLSGDPIMTKIYNENGDIHQMTADACNCERYNAKAINFGLIYKMGAKTLSGQIDKTPAEAQEYIDRYFQNYRGVAQFQDKLIAECRRKGYTWTITGRRRPLRNINSTNFGLKNSDERKAINTQVQGSASDIIKIGMRNFYKKLRDQGLSSNDFRIVGQVHDEVVVEVREEIAQMVCDTLQHEMENCVKLSIPLIAEPCIGDSWGEAK